MADDSNIHGLTELTDVAVADEFAVWDASASIAKRVTYDNFIDAVNCNAYTDFETAVATIGATEKTIVVNDTQSITSNTVVPATLNVIVLKPGVFSISGGVTLTFSGGPMNILAPQNHQIFSGDGSVAFTKGGVVYAEWWGAVSDGTTTGQQAYIQAALDSGTGMTCKLLAGTYLVSDMILISSWDRLIGEGPFTTEIYLDAGSDETIIETDDFDAHEAAEGAYGMMPQNFEISHLSIHGNADNNASGNGMSLHGASYRIDNVVIEKCQDYGFYSNGTRVLGTTYPLGTSDNYNPNALVTRLKVLRCNDTNINYQGPPDAQWEDITSASSQGGYGILINEDINIGYIHCYNNDLANFYATAGFNVDHLEARDGDRQGVSINTSGTFHIGQVYATNNDGDGGDYTTVLVTNGKGHIDQVHVIGQGNSETLLDVIEGSCQFGTIRLNQGAGDGFAMKIGSACARVHIDSVEATNSQKNGVGIEIAGARTDIGSLSLNDQGALSITADGDYTTIGRIAIKSPSDISSDAAIMVAGADCYLGGGTIDNVANTAALKVSGNNNVVGQFIHTNFTGTRPINISGTGVVYQRGVNDEETITGSGAVIQTQGVTFFSPDGGNKTGTLGDGSYTGQRATFMMYTAGGNEFALTVTNHEDGSPVHTFDTNGQMLVLEWAKTYWVTIFVDSNIGVV